MNALKAFLLRLWFTDPYAVVAALWRRLRWTK